MRNKFGFAILVIMLVLGLTVMIWGQSAGISNYTFNSGPPTAAALTAGNLTQAQFNQIRNASAGGFQGWQIRGGNLHLVWTGQTRANLQAVGGVVGGIRGHITGEDNGEIILFYNDYYVLCLPFEAIQTKGVV